MAAKKAAVLDFNSKFTFTGKNRKFKIFFARVVKYDTIKHLAFFVAFYKFIRRNR